MQRTPQQTSVPNLSGSGAGATDTFERGLLASLETMKKSVPVEDGIPLESGPKHKVTAGPKAASNKLSLPKRTKKNKYKGRVGKKAGIMKKTWHVKMSIDELAEG